MKTKHFIVMAVIGGAAVLAFIYLRKSGKWDQWFSTLQPNEFTDEAKLLAFCNAQNLTMDDGGLAVFIDPQGSRHTATCADWIRSQAERASGGQTAGLPAAAASFSGIDQEMLEKLRAAAISSPILGCDRANVDQWNLLLQELDPAAETSDLSQAGIRRGENDTMSAVQYLGLRCQCGLAQVAPPDEAHTNPMAWVN